MSAQPLVIAGAQLLDTSDMTYREAMEIVIEADRIAELRPASAPRPGERRIDVAGRTVIPGMIDAHVHVMGTDENYGRLSKTSPYLVAARAGRVLRGMLMRGFTTVRDAGGADSGLRQAVAEGSLIGPRLFICDLGLAQTGGQGDFRADADAAQGCPVCFGRRSLTRIVDGEIAVRLAVREMLHSGADHIKVMASGGIASSIPIDRLQFSDAEVAVIVDEAQRGGAYVMAHAYMDEAVRRCVRLGIKSIEHASHLNEETCRLIAGAETYIVPTLSVYDAHEDCQSQTGRRFAEMLVSSLESIERAQTYGIAIGHGSDLTGASHERQSREFLLRAEVLSPVEVLRAATVTNAALLGRANELGRLAPGACADLIAIDGDPLENADVLAEPDRRFRLIVKDGVVHKNTLND